MVDKKWMCRLQPAQGWQLPNYNATIGAPWLERGGQYVEARWNRCKCVLTVLQETSSYERSFEHLSRSSHSNPWHVFRVLAFVWMLCLTEISVGNNVEQKKQKKQCQLHVCLFHLLWMFFMCIGYHGTWELDRWTFVVVGNSALTGSVLDVLQRDGSRPMRLATLELWAHKKSEKNMFRSCWYCSYLFIRLICFVCFHVSLI